MSEQPVDTHVIENVVNEVPAVFTETKKGYKTTEFWVVILSAIAVNVQPAVPEKWQAILTGALAIGYALARGHAKAGIPAVDDA